MRYLYCLCNSCHKIVEIDMTTGGLVECPECHSLDLSFLEENIALVGCA